MKSENILKYEIYEDHAEIMGCNDLLEDEIIIPETIQGLPVTSIGAWAFGYQSYLKSVIIPKSVVTIGNGAFANCFSLTSIIIPESVKNIENSVFQECSSLKSITIPDSITNIGIGVFSYCFALEAIHVTPGNCYYMDIDGVLFSKDQKILVAYPAGKPDQSYFIPDSVTKIGEMAFYHCDSLKSITIPDNVIIIGWGAFSYCSSLKFVTIPDSVTDIEESAFSDCSSLESITIQNAECEIHTCIFYVCGYGKQEYTISSTAVIYGYPNSTVQAYAEEYDRKFIALKY